MGDVIDLVAAAIEAQMRTPDNHPRDLARAALKATSEVLAECGRSGRGDGHDFMTAAEIIRDALGEYSWSTE